MRETKTNKYVYANANTYFYSPVGLTKCQLADCCLKIANDFLVVTYSLIYLFLLLAFCWLSFYHVTPFRV